MQAIVAMSPTPAHQALRFRVEAFVAALSTKVTLLLAAGDAEHLRGLFDPYVGLAVEMGITPRS